jgi:hypothetical protein
MSRWSKLAFLALALGTSPGRAETTTVETLMQWWSGNFDNDRQVAAQTGGNGAAPIYEPFFGLRARHRAVEVPALGQHVLFIAEYKNGDPRHVHVIRLQILEPQSDGTVVVSFAPLREPAKFIRNAATLEPDLDKLRAAGPADVIRFNPACSVVLRKTGEVFSGAMAARGCKRGPELYFEYETSISADAYSFREQARRFSDGGVGWEQAPGSNFGEFKLMKK